MSAELALDNLSGGMVTGVMEFRALAFRHLPAGSSARRLRAPLNSFDQPAPRVVALGKKNLPQRTG